MNTHNIASLYEAFEPQVARRLAERLKIHHTPKHGSWLNMAEIELSVLKGQCLDRRISEMAAMQAHVSAWEKSRNNSAKKIVWQFKTSDARIKLRHLYPKLYPLHGTRQAARNTWRQGRGSADLLRDVHA